MKKTIHIHDTDITLREGLIFNRSPHVSYEGLETLEDKERGEKGERGEREEGRKTGGEGEERVKRKRKTLPVRTQVGPIDYMYDNVAWYVHRYRKLNDIGYVSQ